MIGAALAAALLLSHPSGAASRPPPTGAVVLAGAPPLTATPAGGVRAGAPLAILYSGDGGWAATDRGVAAALTRDGIPVAGVDCLHYFWRHRTAEGAAADLDRLIRDRQAAWGARGVVLIGYSFGAAALPLILPHLSPAVLGQVRLVALLGPTPKGELVLRPRSWIDRPGKDAQPVAPALSAVKAPVVCIWGRKDRSTVCPKLDPHKVALAPLDGGHRLHGQYAAVARTIESRL